MVLRQIYLSSRSRDAVELAGVDGACSVALSDPVAFDNGVFYRYLHLREGGKEGLSERFPACGPDGSVTPGT